MELIKIEKWSEVPVNFTGVVLGNKGKYWFFNGKRHREDGPASEYYNGIKCWFLSGKSFKTKEEWFQALTPQQKENALWSSELWKII